MIAAIYAIRAIGGRAVSALRPVAMEPEAGIGERQHPQIAAAADGEIRSARHAKRRNWKLDEVAGRRAARNGPRGASGIP